MNKEQILRSFGIPNALPLGEGVEASVYALDDTRVLRIYKPNGDTTTKQLTALQQFYKSLNESEVSFKTPDVFSVEEVGGRLCTIDRRIYGEEFDKALGHLSGEARDRALLSYIHAAEQVQMLHQSYDYYGEILAGQPLREEDWPTFIRKRLAGDYKASEGVLNAAFPEIQKVMQFIEEEVDIVADTKQSRLVHGDYYVLNVFVDDHQAVSGVMDFNALTLAGDPRMDLASALIFFFMGGGNTQSEDSEVLLNYLIDKYGKSIREIIHLYRLYYAVHFASYCKDSDAATFTWAIQSLQEHLEGDYSY